MNKHINRLPLNLKKILKSLKLEEKKDNEILHLTANESVMSSLASEWQASILNTRYILGPPEERNKKESYFFKKKFLVRGIPAFDELESLAKKACRKLFYCQDSEFSAISGLHGMIAVIGSLTKPGDLIMTLSSQYGGHYATAPLIKKMGRKHLFLPFDIDEFELNLKELKVISNKEKIDMIYLDTMHYFKPYSLKKIKEIVPQSILVYDASHILGLIAGKQFQVPLKEGADILSGNTHKTLPGPQKCMILYKNKSLAQESKPIISSYFVSSCHTGSTISLFITLLEMENFGKDYAQQIVKNSQALASALFKKGFNLVAYPKLKPLTHQVLLIVNNIKESSKLINAGISVNTGSLFDNVQFIRLGIQQATRLGMKEKEMEYIAFLIAKILKENKISQVKKEVKKLRKTFKDVHYCF